jgi:hypothetical protein
LELLNTDVKFRKWDINDSYTFLFSQEITAEFGKVLSENKYKGQFKPNNILPVPKKFIVKAISFTFDYFSSNQPSFDNSRKTKIADSLNTGKVLLYTSFVETGNVDLPIDIRENYIAGKTFLKKQISSREVDDIQFIDWRTDVEWLSKGVRYTEKGQYELAFACYKHVQKTNPEINDLKIILGVTHLTIAEEHIENGNMIQAIENMEISAKLGNEEAITWIRENNI